MWSINWNGQDMAQYGFLLQSHRISLSRSVESLQVQNRAWSTKGKGDPAVITLQVYITGISREQALSNYSTIRGLLDQDDECVLKIDQYTDRYWMAQFNSMTDPVFVGKSLLSATVIMTCYDKNSYSNDTSSQQETLTSNVSASYGGEIYAVCHDSEGDFVYIAGSNTGKVYKLSSIDLTKIAEGPAYGGTIWCICDGGDGYIYYGGDGGAGQYDAVKLDKATMAVEVRGPTYGGVIRAICAWGNFIYYGGDGGAGQYDIAKLDKATMAVELRSVDYGGIIYGMAICGSGTHVLAGGATTQRVSRYLITDLSYVDQSDDYTDTIRAITVSSDGTMAYWCGGLGEVWYAPVDTLSGETQSADLGDSLNCICIDSDYIYAAGDDDYVFKLDIAFAASASYIGRSETYGNNIVGMAIDTTNGWLYIGGQVVNTVWKLDISHLEEVIESDYSLSYIRALTTDDNFIYVASGYYAYKIRKSDLAVVSTSASYGGVITCIVTDERDDYVYIAGETTQKIYVLAKDGLVKTYESVGYGGTIYSLAWYYNGGLFLVYCGGATTQKVYQFWAPTMFYMDMSADYGGVIYSIITLPTGQLYCAGATVQKVFRLDPSGAGLPKLCESADVGGTIYGLAADATNVYSVSTADTVYQFAWAALGTLLTSADLGGDLRTIAVDASAVYVAGVDNIVRKLDITDLSKIADGETYADDIYGLTADDGYIYVGGYNIVSGSPIYKVDKRVLAVRSDHEITVTNSGTARCDPVIGLIANGDNYWNQSIENQTTAQTFGWEGTQADGEELEIDSGLWFVTLEGVSAMSGVSGKFPQLAPGANVLYLENVVGEFIIDWRPRNA